MKKKEGSEFTFLVFQETEAKNLKISVFCKRQNIEPLEVTAAQKIRTQYLKEGMYWRKEDQGI